jgi:hypothetical protein
MTYQKKFKEYRIPFKKTFIANVKEIKNPTITALTHT